LSGISTNGTRTDSYALRATVPPEIERVLSQRFIIYREVSVYTVLAVSVSSIVRTNGTAWSSLLAVVAV
jgi:hypothetical protein